VGVSAASVGWVVHCWKSQKAFQATYKARPKYQGLVLKGGEEELGIPTCLLDPTSPGGDDDFLPPPWTGGVFLSKIQPIHFGTGTHFLVNFAVQQVADPCLLFPQSFPNSLTQKDDGWCLLF